MPPLKIGSLFSGYGGLDLAVESVLDAETAWFVEFDDGPSRILSHRWPGVPNYGDVTKIDWREVPPVDILTGGSPCQDLSNAGRRAGMTEGTRSNLWVNMREAIDTIRPGLVVWENVQGALSAKARSASDMEPGDGSVGDAGGGSLRALGRVLGDLSEIGYDAQWTTIRASDIGAPHYRARVFLVAWPHVPDSESWGRDHGAATHNGTADREVHTPRDDSDAAADSERDNGGPWPGESSGGEETVGGIPTSGLEYRGSSINEDATHPHRVGLQAGDELPVQSVEEIAVADGGVGPLPRVEHNPNVEWGEYASAVRRWERIVGPAPAPTTLNTKGNPHLNAEFAEWMMGLPVGWVTDPSLWEGVSPASARRAQLKMIGNGVCPQQAEWAIRHLLDLPA